MACRKTHFGDLQGVLEGLYSRGDSCDVRQVATVPELVQRIRVPRERGDRLGCGVRVSATDDYVYIAFCVSSERLSCGLCSEEYNMDPTSSQSDVTTATKWKDVPVQVQMYHQ